MATGANDAEGVWINGEDDTYATFSDRLNKSPKSISVVLGNHRTRLVALETGAWADLVLASSWTRISALSARYRKRGASVDLILGVGKANFNSGDTIATLPVGFRPTTVVWLSGSWSGAGRFAHVEPDGRILCDHTSTGGFALTGTIPLG